MNESEVNKQIQQMVHFIRQEAEEKANEIAVSAEEEFNIDKLQLVEAEKKKIRADYDRKERLVTLGKKIEHSTQMNAQRLRYLHAQDDLLRRMRDAAERQLATISNQQGPYAKFLEALIIQGLLRLREPALQIRCRKDDLHLVQAVVQSACEIYANKANVAVPKVSVDDRAFLPGAPQSGVFGSTWYSTSCHLLLFIRLACSSHSSYFPFSIFTLNQIRRSVRTVYIVVWAVWCWQPKMATLCWTTRLMLACRLCSNNSSPRSGSACLVCARMVLLLLKCLDLSELPLPNSWAFLLILLQFLFGNRLTI